MSATLPTVRALTLWQPWATCIVRGTKRIENRSWGTDYRGLLLIHAGKTLDLRAHQVPLTRPFLRRPLPFGAILAVARLIGCHPDDGWCSLWAQPGGWHWHIADVTPLSRPIPYPGERGLWTPPAELLITKPLALALGAVSAHG